MLVMSNCPQCFHSTVHGYDNVLEPYKEVRSVKSSPCTRSHSQYILHDNFQTPTNSVARKYPRCCGSAYGQPFTTDYPQSCCCGSTLHNICPGYWNKERSVTCLSLALNCPYHGDGYRLVSGPSAGKSSLFTESLQCTCNVEKHYVSPALNAPGVEFSGEKKTPLKYRLADGLKSCDASPVRDYGICLPFSHNRGIPMKCDTNLLDEINDKGKGIVKDGLQNLEQKNALAEDILEWKRKHMEQLQIQQTEVSDNNITDELKDKTTSSVTPSSFSSSAAAGATCSLEAVLNHNEEVNTEQDVDRSSDSDISTERQHIEHLEVALRRQDFKVKLYQSMLRKQKHEIQSLQSVIENQTLLAKEDLNSFQKELEHQRKEEKDPSYEPDEQSKPKYVDEAIQTDSFMKPFSCQNHDFAKMECNDEVIKDEIASQSNCQAVATHHEQCLTRLQSHVDEAEQALNSLKQDLANKDQHLKTLRKTLRELSSANCELLEKNLELENQLQQKLNRATGTKREAFENRLLKEVDGCISELSAIMKALMALSSGEDLDPSLLLQGHDYNSVLNDSLTGNQTEAAQYQLERIFEMQRHIDDLRELVLHRILMSRYIQTGLTSTSVT